MLPDLARRWEILEERRSDVLARVAALTPSQRDLRPGTNAWSPVELVHHLILAEEQMGAQVAAAAARAASGRPLRRRALPAPFLLTALAVLRLGIRVPVPDTMVPRDVVSLDVLTDRWEASRRALRERLDSLDAGTRRDPVSLHPLAGPLDAVELLRLIDVHLGYHQRQLAHLCGTVRRAS